MKRQDSTLMAALLVSATILAVTVLFAVVRVM
jgi:hypothetical protein